VAAERTVLLADADVLIDYRESDLTVVALVGRYVGRLAVLPSVLDEVSDVTATDCVALGIEIVEVETERMLGAAALESSVLFNDRLCLVACREEGWTCVTNDGALRRLCERHGVETRFGLGLMVDLVGAGVLTRERAEAVAHRIHSSNPLHINERVLSRFFSALDALVLV
jgi:predicted nucleic acid-binding protein